MPSEYHDFFQENFIIMNESALKKMQIQKAFLIYLDEEGILEDLRERAIWYEITVSRCLENGHFFPPFRFLLKLDLIKIQEVSENLLYIFTKEPDAALNLAKNVIFCGIQFMMLNVELEQTDLQVIPIVVNLPVTCEISDLFQCPSLGLECVQGILMNKTTVSKYIRSSVYACELKYCSKNKWQRYPKNFGNVCPNCLSIMKEDVSSSDTGEELICQIISLKAFQGQRRFQSLKIRVKDELCALTDLLIGEEYKVTGKLCENFFEAMNVSPIQMLTEKNLYSSTLPKSVTEFYHKVSEISPHSSWSFVYALSSSLGINLLPASSYLHLKMGLMLSLTSQESDEAPSPLVAIGPDSLNTQYLFHTAGKLAERYIRHSTTHTYLGGAAKLEPQTDIIWLESGQLILAAKGVFNLGDWSKFKKEQGNYICQTIESGQIVLNKGELGKTNLLDFVPLKCAVWTYWCHITQSRNHQLQLKTLINVFGIPFLAEEKNELEIKKICWKNLKKGKQSFDRDIQPLTISIEDLKEFIKIINTKELCLSDSASQLIRNYFVVSRRERPHCLPMGAIKTLTSLAKAHARLVLKNEVLYDDAIAVIYLYEESISALFGESMSPYPKLFWNQEEPIYVFMGKQLYVFKDWLEEYISTQKNL